MKMLRIDTTTYPNTGYAGQMRGEVLVKLKLYNSFKLLAKGCPPEWGAVQHLLEYKNELKIIAHFKGQGFTHVHYYGPDQSEIEIEIDDEINYLKASINNIQSHKEKESLLK